MKAYKIILFFIITLTILFSCSRGKIKNDLAEENIIGRVKTLTDSSFSGTVFFGEFQIQKVDGILVYSYNEQGNMIDMISYDPADGSLFLKDTYTYDDKGKKVEYLKVFGNSSFDFKTSPNDTYKYDDNGKVIEHNYYIEGYIFQPKVKYNYDDRGNMIEKMYFGSDGSLGTKDTYTYDIKGKMTGWKAFNNDGSLNLKNSIKETWNYDLNGNITENCDFSSDSLIRKGTYNYDDKVNLVEVNHYGANGTLKSKEKYIYDSKRNKIEWDVYLSDGNLSGKHLYNYDSNGNVIEEKTYKAEGILQTIKTCKYDSKNNMIEEDFHGDGIIYIFKKIAYNSKSKYDNNNNKIENIFFNDSGLKTKTTYKYEFDKTGNWIKQTTFENDIPTELHKRKIEYY